MHRQYFSLNFPRHLLPMQYSHAWWFHGRWHDHMGYSSLKLLEKAWCKWGQGHGVKHQWLVILVLLQGQEFISQFGAHVHLIMRSQVTGQTYCGHRDVGEQVIASLWPPERYFELRFLFCKQNLLISEKFHEKAFSRKCYSQWRLTHWAS